MAEPSPIVERALDLLTPTGERIAFRAEFGPVSSDGRDSRCKVRLHGWGDSPPDIHGYDSLQALTLAVELVYALLPTYVQLGGRVVWPGTTDDYDLDLLIPQAKKAESGTEPASDQ